jgi:putative nucleotidyltransferase with HDIG domain
MKEEPKLQYSIFDFTLLRMGIVILWDEAVELVRCSSKFGHVLLVATMMDGLARRLGEDERLWRLVGLLHDLDYDEIRDDMSRHGVAAAERLKGKLPEHCLYAIRAHDYKTVFKPRSRLDKALIAVDTVAVIIERSGKTVEQLNTAMLREEIECVSVNQPWVKRNVLMCEAVGLELTEFLDLSLNAARKEKAR